jgi:nicotinamide mononucleotide transporter
MNNKKLVILELTATILYAASVFLFGFNPETANPIVFKLAWILSCVACPLYVWFFYKKRLYSDVFEQSLYTPLNVIGLLGILFYSAEFTPPEIASMPLVITISLIATLIGTILFRLLVKFLNKKKPNFFPEPASPWLDAFTTVMSLIATVFLILWMPEAWILFLIIDVLAVYVYFKNKAPIVAISYILYTLNAIRGFGGWMGWF